MPNNQPSSRRSSRHYRVKTKKLPWPRILIICACLAVLIISAVQLIGSFSSASRRRRVNAELQALHAEALAALPSAAVQGADVSQPASMPDTSPAGEASAPSQADDRALPASDPAPATPAVERPTHFQLVGTADDILPELQSLYSRNSDLVGWLNIPGVVDLPVVYNNGLFYETHDFYGNNSASGALFLDALHPFYDTTQHLVIHGHNMRDGSMFGYLSRYQQQNYVSAHPTINWTTLFRKETYQIFAVSVVSSLNDDPRHITYLGTRTFKDDAQFNTLMQNLQENAVYWNGNNIAPDEALLTLSTCVGDDRVLVVGHRVSP